MKKKIIFILFIGFSCNNKEHLKLNKGFYFNQNINQIFYFSEIKFHRYDFTNLSEKKEILNVYQDSLKIGSKSYKYTQKDDSLLIIHGFKENKKDLFLKKIEYNFFQIDSIVGTEWMFVNSVDTIIGQESVSRIQNNLEILNFIVNKNEKNVIMTSPDRYIGFLFNKFHTYRSNEVLYCIINLNNGRMQTLDFDENTNEVHKTILKKINTNKIDTLLLGRWMALKRKTNGKSFFNEILNLDPQDEDYLVKREKLKNLFDYSRVEFSKDNYLIRNIINQEDSTKIKYKISYNPYTNYIFYNNTEFLDIEEINSEQQWIEILNLTKDTLEIKISKPNLEMKYVRQDTSNGNESN